MASNYSKELVKELQTYIDTSLTSQKLPELLNQTSADGRYKLLNEVRGWEYTCTGLYEAVRGNDTGIVKLMTQGWTTEQTFAMAELTSRYGRTVLHTGAYNGSTAAVSYLLERLDQDQIFFLLRMRDSDGDTPLHDAVAQKHPEVAKILLASVNGTNQVELLAVKNNKNKSVVELSNFPSLLQVQVQEHDEQQRASTERIRQLEAEMAELQRAFTQRADRQEEDHEQQQRASSERIRQLETEMAEKERTFMQRLNQQEEEMAEHHRAFKQRANEQERELQRLTQNFNRLEVYLRTAEVSDARGDQEIEDY